MAHVNPIVARNGTKVGLYDARGAFIPTGSLATSSAQANPTERPICQAGSTPVPAPLLARLASRVLYRLAAGIARFDRWRHGRA